jgi:hypothetical protein
VTDRRKLGYTRDRAPALSRRDLTRTPRDFVHAFVGCCSSPDASSCTMLPLLPAVRSRPCHPVRPSHCRPGRSSPDRCPAGPVTRRSSPRHLTAGPPPLCTPALLPVKCRSAPASAPPYRQARPDPPPAAANRIHAVDGC